MSWSASSRRSRAEGPLCYHRAPATKGAPIHDHQLSRRPPAACISPSLGLLSPGRSVAVQSAPFLVALGLTLSLASGCQPSGDPTWYGDIQPIIEGRCASCHVDGGAGLFSLEDYTSVLAWKDAVAVAVSSGSMPPWFALDGPAYEYDWSLTEAQKALIVSWVQAGAPEGDPSQQGSPLPDVSSSLSRVDLELGMSESYEPLGDNGDDYRCFPMEWPETESTHITGFNALPGNAALVHHVAAFLIPADNLMGAAVFEEIQAWDDAEEGPGYTCFGGPSGPTGDLQLPIQQLAQWVPGNQGLDLPQGTGIYVEPGSWVVMQVHYNTASPTTERTDQTRLQFRLDQEVEHRGAFAPWLSALWPLSGMEIPAGSSDASFTHEGDPRDFFELLNPSLELEGGFRIHSAMMHMHRLGAGADLHLLRADGSRLPLLSMSNWDFNWQLNYQLEESVMFEEGDSLSLTCMFDNDGENAVTTDWGEGTDDEMCVANLYISLP